MGARRVRAEYDHLSGSRCALMRDSIRHRAILIAAATPPFLVEGACAAGRRGGSSPTSATASASCRSSAFCRGRGHRPARARARRDRALVDAVAEVGVILLLFTIGIEFSLERLAKIKTLIFGGGSLQVGLASARDDGRAGARSACDWRGGAVHRISGGAVVDRDRPEAARRSRRDERRTHGQVSLGLLIFQDLAVIVMVLLVPMLGGDGGGSAGDRVARSAKRRARSSPSCCSSRGG